MGGDVIAYRLPPRARRPPATGSANSELPREALVNVIVRDGNAIPPRGSTELQEGDELHILVRSELRDEVEGLTGHWAEGPDRQAAAAGAAAARRLAGLHGAPGARRRRRSAERDRRHPGGRVMREPQRAAGAYLVALADGRYAVTQRRPGRDRRPAGAGRLVRAARRAQRRRPASAPGGRRSRRPDRAGG